MCSSIFSSVTEYQSRSTSVDETEASLRAQLTPLEQHLLSSHDLLEIRGKVSTSWWMLLNVVMIQFLLSLICKDKLHGFLFFAAKLYTVFIWPILLAK